MISSRSPGRTFPVFPSRQSSCSETSLRRSATPTIITFHNNISIRNNMNMYAQCAILVRTFKTLPQNPPVDDCGESDVGLAWRWHLVYCSSLALRNLDVSDGIIPPSSTSRTSPRIFRLEAVSASSSFSYDFCNGPGHFSPGSVRAKQIANRLF